MVPKPLGGLYLYINVKWLEKRIVGNRDKVPHDSIVPEIIVIDKVAQQQMFPAPAFFGGAPHELRYRLFYKSCGFHSDQRLYPYTVI